MQVFAQVFKTWHSRVASNWKSCVLARAIGPNAHCAAWTGHFVSAAAECRTDTSSCNSHRTNGVKRCQNCPDCKARSEVSKAAAHPVNHQGKVLCFRMDRPGPAQIKSENPLKSLCSKRQTLKSARGNVSVNIRKSGAVAKSKSPVFVHSLENSTWLFYTVWAARHSF